MPFLPTPESAAQTRADGGFWNAVVHNGLTHGLGLGSLLYNIGGTGLHMLEGTTGQWGPPTTVAGRISQIFTGRNTNGPVGPGYSPTGETPGDIGDPTNPANYALPGQPPAAGSSGAPTAPNAVTVNPGGFSGGTIGGTSYNPGMAGFAGMNPAFFNSLGSPLERQVYNRMH